MAIASDVLTRVRDTLQDKLERRWTDAELCRWIDDGQRLVIQLKPEAHAGFVDHPLIAGSKQNLPDSLLSLLEVVANGTQSSPSTGLREASKPWFDRVDPSWQFGTQTTLSIQYMRDEDKRVFYVYPPNDGNGSLILQGGLRPSVVEDAADTLELDDVFIKPLTEYVCAKALSKDADNPANRQLSEQYLGQFYASLGMAVETERGD